MKNNQPSKLLWMDLEMTGLNPRTDRILEVGVIITDFDFNELDSYEAVIYQEESVLEMMKKADWYEYTNGRRKKVGTVYDMATQNGLLDKIRSGRKEKEVEKDIVKLINKNFDQLAILAGNSIHQDRRFIREWWPDVEKQLHYRMLDVSSFKVFMQGRFGQEFKKPDQHRALEDIRGSIQELGYYLRKMPELLSKEKRAGQ